MTPQTYDDHCQPKIESSSQRAAGAKPSKLRTRDAVHRDFADLDHAPEVDQGSAHRSHSCPSSSESYPKSRRNQLSFHIALGVQYRRPVMRHPVRCLGLRTANRIS